MTPLDARRSHDIGDAMDKLIDTQLERLALPKSSRERGRSFAPRRTMTYPCSGCGLRSCDGRCFSECPADYVADEETISATTLAELRKIHGDPLIDAYAEYLALRSGNLGLTETQSDPFKRRRAA